MAVAIHLKVKTGGRDVALTLSTRKLHVWKRILQYIKVLYRPLLIKICRFKKKM